MASRALAAAGSAALLALALALALALRLPHLGARPMHADESVHTVKFAELWTTGRYTYDPNEFHGPTLYYATLPSVLAARRADFAGTRERDFRLPVALAGSLLVLAYLLFAPGLGRSGAAAAALLAAASPSMVYYSRYYIQETFLALFTVVAVGCGWRWLQTRRTGWLMAAAVFAGLMQASKETAVVAVAAAGASLALEAGFRRLRRDGPPSPWPPASWRVWLGALLLGPLTAVGLLSCGFRNPQAAVDIVRTYLPWLQRAGGATEHIHPWWTYLSLLFWVRKPEGPAFTEAAIAGTALLGLLWAFAARPATPKAADRASLARLTGVQALLMLSAYSVIPYKTPWCVVSLVALLCVPAGAAFSALWDRLPAPARVVPLLALLAAVANLTAQAMHASGPLAADPRSPYVYAHTEADILRLQRRVLKIADANAAGHAMVVKVIWTDHYYWPLPWYLRGMANVAYYDAVPASPDAPVVISHNDHDEALTAKLKDHLMTGFYKVRPGVFAQLWVRMDAWQRFLERRKPGDEE
ncbi:MAG: TIGR03663 family protein [Armatimonadetes bacterium]|nr:TIGR03663 family protein [Armatimonadota bacterium]